MTRCASATSSASRCAGWSAPTTWRTWSCSCARRSAATSPGSRSASAATSRRSEGGPRMALDLPVAIVGTGLIGRAWALAFARAGCDVRLWDPTEGAVAACLTAAGRLIDDLAAQDLLDGQAPEAVRGRMRPAADLAAALDGVAWVQENAPERVEVKRALWAQMDRLGPPPPLPPRPPPAPPPPPLPRGVQG